MEDVLHEPRAMYYFSHVSRDLDVAITTGDGWRMNILPNTEEIHKLIRKKVLSAFDMEKIARLTSNKIGGDNCCVPECGNRSDGIDRGKPLCDSCWAVQDRISENMADRFHTPKEIDIESEDTYGILFG